MTIDAQTDEQTDGERVFEQAAQPAGVIEFPEGMSDDDREAFVEQWKARQAAAIPEPFGEPLDASALDELSHEEATELASEAIQVNVPTMEIPLQGCALRIIPGPNEGDKQIVVGPVAMTFILPLSGAGVEYVTKELNGSSIVVAKAMPSGLEMVKG